MTARPVPFTGQQSAMYAVMTAEPLDTEGLIAPPSPELLRHYGSSEPALLRLASRPHQKLLVRRAAVHDIAFTLRDTMVEALQLAEHHDGVVVDLRIPRIVELRARDVSLAHATQWYCVDYAELASGRILTIGLSAFGLPEIAMIEVDRRGHAMFSAVLAGLAHRLIAEWPASDPVGPATVTLRDIAYGLGDDQAPTTPKDRAVRLDIRYDPDAALLVVRPVDDPAVTLFGP
jgi:hypothetical protein